MIYIKDIDEDEPVLVSRKYYYPPSERLMCNSCGTVSSNHLVGNPPFLWKHDSWPEDWEPQWVCLHTCKRCGRNVDKDLSHSFTDSGNYICDETVDIYKWKEELDELEKEVEDLKFKLKKGEARWAELWETDEDAT